MVNIIKNLLGLSSRRDERGLTELGIIAVAVLVAVAVVIIILFLRG